jgi:flagellar hook-basal body complex protein FliE
MDVKMNLPLLSALRTSQAAGPVTAGSSARAVAAAAAPGFSGALDAALKSVSATQENAAGLQRAFQAGAEGVSLEETMVAMQKAQIAFQSATTVRNRLVSAYTDIMNMSV